MVISTAAAVLSAIASGLLLSRDGFLLAAICAILCIWNADNARRHVKNDWSEPRTLNSIFHWFSDFIQLKTHLLISRYYYIIYFDETEIRSLVMGYVGHANAIAAMHHFIEKTHDKKSGITVLFWHPVSRSEYERLKEFFRQSRDKEILESASLDKTLLN